MPAHEIVRSKLAFHMTRRASDDVRVVAEAQLNLTDDAYVLPDILVHPAAINVARCARPNGTRWSSKSPTAASGTTSLTKAPLYASYGVREYWVIDAKTLLTTVYRKPSGSEFSEKEDLTADERLVPEAVPTLAVTLRDLDFDRFLRRYVAGLRRSRKAARRQVRIHGHSCRRPRPRSHIRPLRLGAGAPTRDRAPYLLSSAFTWALALPKSIWPA